jgi:CBS domain-containing protein
MARTVPITDVMTSPVITLRPDDTIESAVATLVEHGVSGAPVVDEDGRLVGLLDDTDLLLADARLHGPTTVQILGANIPLPGERHRLEDEVRRALAQVVGEVMDREPAILDLTATVEDAATIIVDREVSRVPIVDGGRVVGIVTRGDLVQAMYRAGRADGRAARP